MALRYFYTIGFLLMGLFSNAQQSRIDSANSRKNTASPIVVKVDAAERDTSATIQQKSKPEPAYYQVIRSQSAYAFFDQPAVYSIELRKQSDWSSWFYVLTGVFAFFAFLRLAFPKYLQSLFQLMRQTSFKQRQIREQLMQTPLPAMLWNLFFMISAGTFSGLVLWHGGYIQQTDLLSMALWSSLALFLLYTGKFLLLKVGGWLFNQREAMDVYSFIIFMINKWAGIWLLPFLLILSFSTASIQAIAIPVALVGLVGLVASRFIFSFLAIHREISVTRLHFLLYLCAFEIAPILVIYKVLVDYFSGRI